MIDLQDCIDKCYAEISHDCSLLVETAEQCNYKCAFYKPKGCRDWIRVETKRHICIVPPEEYAFAIRRRYEQRTSIRKQEELH